MTVIVFDCDGVLRQLNLAMIHVCDAIGNYQPGYVDSICNTKPLLNPMDFALPEDDLYCLTRCSSEESAQRKAEWLYHWYGSRIKFKHILMNIPNSKDNWGPNYTDKVAYEKYHVLKEIGADIYFDDDPGIIRSLRELYNTDFITDKKIIFIKYGPWIEEYSPSKEDVR